jgi:hypothetical protein
VTPRQVAVLTPAQVAAFGRFDCPEQYMAGTSPLAVNPYYTLVETFIDAATDEVETLAATACVTEQVYETYDFFPGQQDPRSLLNFQLGYTYDWAPWWWYGFQSSDSIELVRRPVIVPGTSPVTDQVVITYFDTNGVLQTMDPTTYTVACDKICLNVGSWWPLTDRRQDCIQVEYWAGYGDTAATVPSRLQLAVMFLAAHYWDNRNIVTIEPTSETYMTLMSLLAPYRSMRIPR